MNTVTNWEIITLWDLPYPKYLELLEEKKSELHTNKDRRYLLICSHPHCFTHGRGLRNLKDGKELINFDLEQKEQLRLPLYQINRGGGLTFHYPGQVIIYPILNLNVFPKALMTLMHIMLLTIGDTLKELKYLTEYQIPKDIYGLWSENKKIASIGMGLDHYITEHGLALNFFHDQYIFNLLNQFYPCGISAKTYSSVEQVSGRENLNRDDFTKLFLDNFLRKFS